MSDSRPDTPGDGMEWKYAVEDVDENGVVTDTLEPGNPALENMMFVLLGVAIAVFVVVRGIGLV